jgi:BirA family biotin operon repressor/biotin-[acetyl-CoA-carboxylase] ligase
LNRTGPLTADDLLPDGPLRRLGQAVHVHDTLESTNAYLLSHVVDIPDGAIAWAEYQSQGRGRLGRRWEMPRGAGLLLSVAVREPRESPLCELAGLLGAVALCRTIEQATDCEPGVRWPNDVVLEGRKLGGVLVESASDNGQRVLVIGIGLNCLQQAGHFEGELAEKAISLEMASTRPIDRPLLASRLLQELDGWLTGASAVDELRRLWRERCVDIGSRVRLQHDLQSFVGTAVDIAENGDLLVQLDEGGRRQFGSTTTTREW